MTSVAEAFSFFVPPLALAGCASSRWRSIVLTASLPALDWRLKSSRPTGSTFPSRRSASRSTRANPGPVSCSCSRRRTRLRAIRHEGNAAGGDAPPAPIDPARVGNRIARNLPRHCAPLMNRRLFASPQPGLVSGQGPGYHQGPRLRASVPRLACGDTIHGGRPSSARSHMPPPRTTLVAALTMLVVAAGCGGHALVGRDARPAPAHGDRAALMAVHRGGTLKLLAVSGPGTIAPQVNYWAQYWQLFQVTHDGLLAFKKAGGDASFQVVPDLAEAIPQPTNGGRTWVFKLRQGIRFSNGKTVTATD